MEKNETISKLIGILKEFKDDLGANEVNICPETIPVGGIPGFDSLLGVAATAHIAELFDIPDDKRLDNLFGDTKKNGEIVHYSVSQMAEKILKMKKGK